MQILRLLVRAWLLALKRARHAWQHAKPVRRVGWSARRAAKRVSDETKALTAWLREIAAVAVRAWLRTMKVVRHALHDAKPVYRLKRRLLHLSRLTRDAVRDAVRWVRRPVTRILIRARQWIYYRPPGEWATCPACGSRDVQHLEPLAYTRPIEYMWRVGFITGCRSCGLLFANPLPSDTHLAEVYSPEGDWGRSRQDEEEKQVSPARLARVLEPIAGDLPVLHPPAGASVLDFGCGLGGLLDTLAACGWVTYGIDPATKAAFRRHREVIELPSTPAFDLVVLHHVLEHVKDPLGILRGLATAVHPGGYVFVSVPNLDAVAEHGDMQYCLRSKTHVMAYSATCLAWLLAEAGFELISAQSVVGSMKGRQMAAIGRRSAAAVPPPRAPLEGALAALARYRTAMPAVRTGWPMRLQAARLNADRERGSPGEGPEA